MAKKAQKRIGSALDLGMAAFAGTAAGFVMFAMPEAQFYRIVELSGLPLLVTAAQPPLGMTARAAAIVAAAAGTWTFVWLLLRALSKPAPKASPRPKPLEVEMPVPRLRRADSHPDAPARAPIFAELELGTPLDQAAAPAWEAAGDDEPDGQLDHLPPREDHWGADDSDFGSQPTTSYPHSYPESIAHAQAEDAADDADFSDFMDLDASSDETALSSRTEPAPQSVAAAAQDQASIAHLMQRLELGLLRRERSGWSALAEEAGPAIASPPALDERLRSAITDLQRLAARG